MLFSGDTQIDSVFYKDLPNWSERMRYFGFDKKRKCHYFIEDNAGENRFFVRKLDENWNLIEEFNFSTKYPNLEALRSDRGISFSPHLYDGITDSFYHIFNTDPGDTISAAGARGICKITMNDNLADWVIDNKVKTINSGAGNIYLFLGNTDKYYFFAAGVWTVTAPLDIFIYDIENDVLQTIDVAASLGSGIAPQASQVYKKGEMYYFTGRCDGGPTIIGINPTNNNLETIQLPSIYGNTLLGVKFVGDGVVSFINNSGNLITYDYVNEVEINEVENWGNGLWNNNSFFEDSKIKSISTNDIRFLVEQQSTSNKPLFSGDVVAGEQVTKDKPLANL